MKSWDERARERRERRLSGDELQRAVTEAADKLFSIPSPAPPVTDAEVQEAAEKLFGHGGRRRLRERRGDR